MCTACCQPDDAGSLFLVHAGFCVSRLVPDIDHRHSHTTLHSIAPPECSVTRELFCMGPKTSGLIHCPPWANGGLVHTVLGSLLVLYVCGLV